mgnify:CR=1 FL=1
MAVLNGERMHDTMERLLPGARSAALLWQGISSSFNVTNVTEYTNANELNPLAWFLPLKAATLYDGVGEIASSRYLAWNASMNAAVPPIFCACATVCSASVVLPEDSGP